MIFLVLSDLHSAINHYFIEDLVSRYHADAVMLLGDLTNFGPPDFILHLKTEGTKVFAIPGNCDPPEIMNYFENAGMINMHRRLIELYGLKLIGLGGADYGFINLGIGYTDEIAYNFLSSNLDENSILMLHQPPYGILDSVHGKNAGNRGIRKAVDEKKPFIVMSGHIHEERGVKRIGKTLFFNPGPAKEGYFAILTVEGKDTDVQLLKK